MMLHAMVLLNRLTVLMHRLLPSSKYSEGVSRLTSLSKNSSVTEDSVMEIDEKYADRSRRSSVDLLSFSLSDVLEIDGADNDDSFSSYTVISEYESATFESVEQTSASRRRRDTVISSSLKSSFRDTLDAPLNDNVNVSENEDKSNLSNVLSSKNSCCALCRRNVSTYMLSPGDPEPFERSFEETRYLSLIERILREGELRENRTQVKTISLFGETLSFDLSRNRFPLFTVRRIFFRGVVEELLWFLRGSTESVSLSERGVNIWNANSTRDFLDSRGLFDYAPGELGPVYGFQWRYFGATYCSRNDDDFANGDDEIDCRRGFDQIAEIVRLLNEEPFSRRILLTAWNPPDLKKMALPPCHVMSQFLVSETSSPSQYRGKLSCLVFQRSCDVALGLPFNVASYALLTAMLAHKCRFELGSLKFFLGDAHVYVNQIDKLRELLQRKIYRGFPSLEIRKSADEVNDLTDYKFDDFVLHDYYPYERLDIPFTA